MRDLKKEGFVIFEDGIPQKISDFCLVDIPFKKAPALSRASDYLENGMVANDDQTGGRIYLIILDNVHIDFQRIAQTKRIARWFIENKLGANDQAAVMSARNGPKTRQWLTGDRQMERWY